MYPQFFPGTALAVSSYGVLMGVALVLMWAVALGLARSDRLPADRLGSVLIVAAVSGLITARVAWLLQHGAVVDVAAVRTLPAGGLAFSVGAVVAVLATWVGCRRYGVPVVAWLDCVAPGLAVAAIFERIGALLVGADFGRYVGVGEWGYAFAVRYPADAPATISHANSLRGFPGVSAAGSAPVHPVQVYAAVLALLVVFAVPWLRRRRAYSGQVFFAVVALLVAGQVPLAPLHHGTPGPEIGPLRPVFIAGFGLLCVLWIADRLVAIQAARQPGRGRWWHGGPWSPPA